MYSHNENVSAPRMAPTWESIHGAGVGLTVLPRPALVSRRGVGVHGKQLQGGRNSWRHISLPRTVPGTFNCLAVHIPC
ncbi:hypothetical protein RRG08_038573 [Elysia crispata]|uniref:Uncharacterized protein n=1 Tax=Elysia crispata TaxID=231223 RepID=A0AAE1CY26_9GAST|nr:hypothetical protein RRG08_038573 [Elysia crispata]